MGRKRSQHIREEALSIFKTNGGVLTTSEALSSGIHPRILYQLRDEGKIEKIVKGIYALPGLPGIEQPDFVTIAKKIPSGIICLISALYYHKLTVQIPRWVDLAVRQGYHPPSISYPPIQFHWYSNAFFDYGAERHDIGGISINIYSKEKTIVDCFRLRKKVGLDVAFESLKTYWQKGNVDMDLLEKYADSSRVLRIMKPYIKAVTHDQS